MPKVSSAYDLLLERLIFAYDGTSYRVVKCDTDGNVVAALKAGQSVEVTQDTAADLKATVNVAAAQTIAVTQATAASLKALVDLNTNQNVQARGHGWIGAAWRKNPIPFGFSDVVAAQVSNLSAAAGYNALVGGAVPAGEAWIVQAACTIDINSTTTQQRIAATIDDVQIPFQQGATIAGNYPLVWSGQLMLGPGDWLWAEFAGCTLNDDIYLRWQYARIDTDQ